MVSKRQLPQEEIEKAVSEPRGCLSNLLARLLPSLHTSRGRAPVLACLE